MATSLPMPRALHSSHILAGLQIYGVLIRFAVFALAGTAFCWTGDSPLRKLEN